jgi:hypothetical protein
MGCGWKMIRIEEMKCVYDLFDPIRTDELQRINNNKINYKEIRRNISRSWLFNICRNSQEMT